MQSHSDISLAITELSKLYYRVVKVNLATDMYEDVLTRFDSPSTKRQPQPISFSELIREFGEGEKIYINDRKLFQNRLSIPSLRTFLKNSNHFYLQYRRLIGGEYRWVSLEIFKTENYTEEYPTVWLFVRDIHDSHSHEIEIQRELEHYCKYDSLTSLNNYYSYQILCKNFSAKIKKNPIGILFADLNGLKLINDTRGHGAGNDFLQSFSKKLLNHFSDEHIYRISGDEFLVIIPNTNKIEFTIAAKKFEDFLNSEAVPSAAVGYSWMEHPNRIEDVCQEAEAMMYHSKEAFYQKHPEYKRGIAELNYKREMDAILKTLANSYDLILSIDLQHNSYIVLKTVQEDFFKGCSESYSELTEKFMNGVDPEYTDILAKVNSIRSLRISLQKKSALTAEFKMKDGNWFRTTYKAIETLSGEPIKVLMISELLDHDRILELEKTKDLLFEHQIIEGLSKNYSLICQIDVPSKTISIYRNISLKDTISAAINSLEYDAVIDWFVQKYVIVEDRERTASALRIHNITDKLKEHDITSVLFRTVPEFHDTKSFSYSMFYFYRLNSNPNKIVLATKNVTNSMG